MHSAFYYLAATFFSALCLSQLNTFQSLKTAQHFLNSSGAFSGLITWNLSAVHVYVIYFEYSSSFTFLKKSQYIQDLYFFAYVPCISPLQKVPTTYQHALPPFMPPFSLSRFSAVAAGHTPKSPLCWPSGCLPHFVNSQQLSLLFLFISKYFVFTEGRAHLVSHGISLCVN